jgi:N-acetylglutamate synthase-like GNAT family acetyltransferase
MALNWVREDTPKWDAAKQAIVAAAPKGALDLPARKPGDLAPGEWFRVEDEGKVVGYGWMDCTWGDAEITLAVDPASAKRGVGSFILDRLAHEAAARGLNYLYNTVRPTHPDRASVTRWLEGHGFTPSGEDGLLRRRVGR